MLFRSLSGTTEEHYPWTEQFGEFGFLLDGLASPFAIMIYVLSTILADGTSASAWADLAMRAVVLGNSVTEYYMAISPDWKLALAASGLLDFTDPQQPRPVLPSIPTPAAQSAYDAAFSPDGRLLALSLRDKSVRLWDLSTGRPWGQVMKTADGAAQMAFSPDGRLLVTAGVTMTSPTDFSGSIRLWETATGQPCGLPLPFSGMPADLRLDPNLKFACVSIAQMGGGKRPPSVQVWGLPSAEMPLADMERKTWLKAGSRLDASGNLEIIPAREIQQLEVATP